MKSFDCPVHCLLAMLYVVALIVSKPKEYTGNYFICTAGLCKVLLFGDKKSLLHIYFRHATFIPGRSIA